MLLVQVETPPIRATMKRVILAQELILKLVSTKAPNKLQKILWLVILFLFVSHSYSFYFLGFLFVSTCTECLCKRFFFLSLN
jgi:hypothetical protein